MKKLIIIALLLITGVSCKAPNPIVKEVEVIRIEKEVLRDTIIDIKIKEMFVEKQTKDTSSELRTDNAFSRALWSNGTLYHSLEQKGVQPTKIVVKDRFVYDTIKSTDTLIKEVDKKLNWWQTLFVWSGGIFYLSLALIIIFLLGKAFIFRNK